MHLEVAGRTGFELCFRHDSQSHLLTVRDYHSPLRYHLRLSTATTLTKSATRLRKARSSVTDPSASQMGFSCSRVEAVYLARSLCNTPGGEYMRQARKHGLRAGGFVSLTERESIVDWLHRTIPTLDSIVPLSGVLLFLPPFTVAVLLLTLLKSRLRLLEHRHPLLIVCLPRPSLLRM